MLAVSTSVRSKRKTFMGFEFFRRGRGLSILVALSAALLVAALLMDRGQTQTISLAAAIMVGLFYSLMSISSRKRSEGLMRQALRHNAGLEKAVSQLLNAFQEQKYLSDRQRLNELDESFSTDFERQRDGQRSIYAPSTIPSSRIVGRPTAQNAGRAAAAQDMEGESGEVLQALMRAPADAWVRRVALIGSKTLEKELSAVCEVERIRAPHLLGNPKEEHSFIVIDEGALDEGLWSGLLSTRKTTEFIALLEHIESAKKMGAVVVVLATELANHFSNELRSHATVVLGRNVSSWHWQDDIDAPVIETLNGKFSGGHCSDGRPI